ncbi:hypothetical protein Rs2_38836 [Raphanus sativus]|nr:hypothetical protein Rs2_38836 [Raphanus sativus]
MFTASLRHEIIRGKIQNLGLIPLLDFTELDHSFSNSYGLRQDMYTDSKHFYQIDENCKQFIIVHNHNNLPLDFPLRNSHYKRCLGISNVEVVSEVGGVDASVAQFVKWMMPVMLPHSTMDTPLAMGALVSARLLKLLLITTVHNRDVQCMDALSFLILEVECGAAIELYLHLPVYILIRTLSAGENKLTIERLDYYSSCHIKQDKLGKNEDLVQEMTREGMTRLTSSPGSGD